MTTLTDALACVGLVSDRQFGYVALNRLRYLVRRETHGVHVVCSPSQRVVGNHEVLGDGSQAVVHVHHRQTSVSTQETFVVAGPQSVVEYLARVICPSSTQTVTREAAKQATNGRQG